MLGEAGAGNRISGELEIINANPCSELECCRAAASPALEALSSFCRAQQAPLPNKPAQGRKVFCLGDAYGKDKGVQVTILFKGQKEEKLLS